MCSQLNKQTTRKENGPMGNQKKMMKPLALAEWLSRLECCPVHRKSAGSTPSQGPYLGCRFNPQSGYIPEATDGCFSLTSMSASLPLSLSLSGINE